MPSKVASLLGVSCMHIVPTKKALHERGCMANRSHVTVKKALNVACILLVDLGCSLQDAGEAVPHLAGHGRPVAGAGDLQRGM